MSFLNGLTQLLDVLRVIGVAALCLVGLVLAYFFVYLLARVFALGLQHANRAPNHTTKE